MSKEILIYAGAIAHEKNIDVEDVLSALEKGIVTSLAKKHGPVNVSIHRNTGAISIVSEDGRDMSDEWGRQDASRVKQVWGQVLADLQKKAEKKNQKKGKK